MVREYVVIRKGDQILFEIKGFKPIEMIIKDLKSKKLSGKIEIDYRVKVGKELYSYAIFYLKDYIKKGWVFPCGLTQNSN